MAEQGLEEAMRNLNLSVAERKGIKLGKQIAEGSREDDWHAVGKIFAEKLFSADGIIQTLGRIWCSDRGMSCKEMGDNIFLFRFNHPSGARRALEDGPWMAGHNLLVMVEYDRRRALEAVEFTHIPIWIRVSKLPMGMMNVEAAKIIGNEVGCFIDVDVEENGTAVGRYLRVKVKIDIRVPLRRGIMIEIEEEVVEQRWCPLEYEFLPEFCYTCGVIGHTDKNCNVSLGDDMQSQYGKWLRVMPPRRRFNDAGIARRSSGSSSYNNEARISRSNGDWRKDKDDRLQTEEGKGGGDNLVGKVENKKVGSGDGTEDDRAKAELSIVHGTVAEKVQDTSATYINVTQHELAQGGQKENVNMASVDGKGSDKRGRGTYRRRVRTEVEAYSNHKLLAGKKRAMEKGDDSTGKFIGAKKFKGNDVAEMRAEKSAVHGLEDGEDIPMECEAERVTVGSDEDKMKAGLSEQLRGQI